MALKILLTSFLVFIVCGLFIKTLREDTLFWIIVGTTGLASFFICIGSLMVMIWTML